LLFCVSLAIIVSFRDARRQGLTIISIPTGACQHPLTVCSDDDGWFSLLFGALCATGGGRAREIPGLWTRRLCCSTQRCCSGACQPSSSSLDCGSQVVADLGALRVCAPRRTAESTPAVLACAGYRSRLLFAHLVSSLLLDG